MENTDNDDDSMSYKVHMDELKRLGNEAFADSKFTAAVQYFTQGIEVDPDNYMLYSNRSAAYMKLDYISKALKDAEKCVDLAPNWLKGYNRLGVAQQCLKRFDDAIKTFTFGLSIDTNDQTLKNALSKCQEAKEKDKLERFAKAAIEREKEEERLRKVDEFKEKMQEQQKQQQQQQQQEQQQQHISSKNADDLLGDFFTEVDTIVPIAAASTASITTATVGTNAVCGETDLLAGFFDEIDQASSVTAIKVAVAVASSDEVRDEKVMTPKYATQDLGNGNDQVSRLTQKHYEWKNLNPYSVLQLDTDATEEDVTYRYRKLSSKVHPDKLLHNVLAREAFEEVKNAYIKLCDQHQKKIIRLNIEAVREDIRLKHKKGGNGSTQSDLDEDINKAVMKCFADMEMQRRRADKHIHLFSVREKMQAQEEMEKLKKTVEFEKEWSESSRVEERINNWKSFQAASGDMVGQPQAKKSKVSTDDYKSKWK